MFFISLYFLKTNVITIKNILGIPIQTNSLKITFIPLSLKKRSIPIGEIVTITMPLERAGITSLNIEVEAGKEELTLQNNKAVVEINAIRERLKVMLVSGEPNMGLRSWRNLLNSDPSVDLIHFTILRPPNKQDLTPVGELSLIPFPSRELFQANLKMNIKE